MKKLTRGQVALITIVLVLIVDQAVKIWVKTHMYIGESIRVTDWFYIAFIENNGMAFGMEVVLVSVPYCCRCFSVVVDAEN